MTPVEKRADCQSGLAEAEEEPCSSEAGEGVTPRALLEAMSSSLLDSDIGRPSLDSTSGLEIAAAAEAHQRYLAEKAREAAQQQHKKAMLMELRAVRIFLCEVQHPKRNDQPSNTMLSMPAPWVLLLSGTCCLAALLCFEGFLDLGRRKTLLDAVQCQPLSLFS